MDPFSGKRLEEAPCGVRHIRTFVHLRRRGGRWCDGSWRLHNDIRQDCFHGNRRATRPTRKGCTADRDACRVDLVLPLAVWTSDDHSIPPCFAVWTHAPEWSRHHVLAHDSVSRKCATPELECQRVGNKLHAT